MITTTSNRSLSLNNLNEPQYKAATHESGTLQVIAGAGSGKTRVITSRILNLILNRDISASSIVALTFTNKAAHEMLERVRSALTNTKHVPFIGTFHSYCLMLLKQHAIANQTGPFTILDEEDQQKLIKTILQRANIDKQITSKQMLYQISQIKNTYEKNLATHHIFSHPLLKDVYTAYEHEKRISNCKDFDDLLIDALHLFSTDQNFKTRFQQRIKHVLVDEYQDTNTIQHALLTQMTKDNNQLAVDSLCIVGDEDQSIYSWRGATIENMLNVTRDFPDTTIIKLEQNYRSVQPILSLANAIIEQNKLRNPKNLWSSKQAANRICKLYCLSEYQEANVIADFITTASRHQKRDSIAILYRTHAQSRAIEEAFIKHAIPYKIIGNIQFYERKEIKDILAYLRLLVNPRDRSSFFRVLNTPSRGLGEKVEELLYNEWNLQPFMDFNEIIDYVATHNLLPNHRKSALIAFKDVFNTLSAESMPTTAIEHIISAISYIKHIKDAYEPLDAASRIDNIKELIRATTFFETTKQNPSLELFLDEVSLMQESLHASQENSDTVSIMTLHAAKGLEFHTVALVGLEEGLLPSARSLNNTDSIEEERRLFYVGVTRAQERLLITHGQHRYTYGSMVDQHMSRFLDDIPNNLMNIQDARAWKQGQAQTFFTQWISGIKPTIPPSDQGFQKAVSSSTKPVPSNVRQTGNTKWRVLQPVKHARYGIGTIQQIEERHDGTCLHVRFKSGLKKIMSNFIESF